MATLQKRQCRIARLEFLERKFCLSSVTFVPQPTIDSWSGSAPGGYRDIQVADLDGDQNLDLLVSTSSANSWYRNADGLGGFKFVSELAGSNTLSTHIENACDVPGRH